MNPFGTGNMECWSGFSRTSGLIVRPKMGQILIRSFANCRTLRSSMSLRIAGSALKSGGVQEIWMQTHIILSKNYLKWTIWTHGFIFTNEIAVNEFLDLFFCRITISRIHKLPKTIKYSVSMVCNLFGIWLISHQKFSRVILTGFTRLISTNVLESLKIWALCTTSNSSPWQ